MKMIRTQKTGRDIVGCFMICKYKGSKDTAPRMMEGTVKSQRYIEGKGTLIVFETRDGFRSVYFERATDVIFYVPRNEETRNTDDGYDEWKDNHMSNYGDIPRRRYR